MIVYEYVKITLLENSLLFEMSEILTVKKAMDGCPKSMLDYYYTYLNRRIPAMEPFVARNLNQLLVNYSPYECIKLIADKEKVYDNTIYLKETYLFLVCHLTALHIDHKEYEHAVLWARKTMDLIDFLFQKETERFRSILKEQSFASEVLNEFGDYLDNEAYRGFNLEWEFDIQKAIHIANDNLGS